MKRETLKDLSSILLSFLFLFVIHVNIRNLGGQIVTPVAFLVWIGVSCIILFSVLSALFLKDDDRLMLPGLGIYIIVFLVLFMLPAFINPAIDMHSFVFKKLGLLAGLLFFVSMHQFRFSDEDKERLLYVIFLSGVIEACIGSFQYFSPGLIIPFVAFSKAGDVFGNFQHQNVFATFLATSLVISLNMIISPVFRAHGRWYRSAHYIAVAVISFALFIAGSRAGLIGLALGCIILFIARLKDCRKAPLFLAVWLLAVFIGVGGNIISEKYLFQKERGIFYTSKKLKVASESLIGERATDPRSFIYRVSYEMFKDKPLLGHGPGGFTRGYVHYRKDVAAGGERPLNISTFTYYPHNEVLYILVESGMIGGAGLLLVTFIFLLYLFRLGREMGGRYAAFLIPVVFHAQVEFPFYQSAVHWILFLILCYMPSSHFVREVRFRPAQWLKTALLAVAICIFLLANLFLVKTLSANIGLTKYYRLLTQDGVSRMKYIEPALNNLYLGRFSQRMMMDLGLGMALEKDNKDFLNGFTEWADQERRAFPHYLLYEGETKALSALGRRDEALRLVEEGLSLYPDNQELLDARNGLLLQETVEPVR
jgi:O-antigen polymerase